MERRTFRHIDYFTKNGGVGHISACCELEQDGTLRVAFAFCSPKERQFNKKKGRLISEGRLDKGLFAEVAVHPEDTSVSLFRQITEAIWDDALLEYDVVLEAAGKEPPQWVYDNLELNYYTPADTNCDIGCSSDCCCCEGKEQE